MYKQVLDPVGDSLGLSSIFAALPNCAGSSSDGMLSGDG